MTTQQQTRQVAISTPSEREIRFERTFDAGRDLVWSTFTDPTLISKWWGGGVEVEHMDFRVGGTWKFLGGHMPDGSKFVFEGEYLEIEPPQRIVQTYVNGWMNGMTWTETMEFEDMGDQTRFTQTSRFESTEQRDMVLPTVEQGANFTYSRLDQLLATLAGGN